MINLKGLHILITRPQAQAVLWADQLRKLGAVITCSPMLLIKPLNDETSKQRIRNRISDLDKYQKIIFISQNAVNFGFEWIDQYWPQLPIDQKLLAIGSTTASLLEKKLSQWGGNIGFPLQAMNSEALLALPALQFVQDEKILICRGQGGRTYLAESLEHRGAQVDSCELYQRCAPTEVKVEHIQQFKNSRLKPVITVCSGETLNNLCVTLPENDLPWFKQQALLVPSERVAQQSEKLHFKQIISAENATHDGMIGALYEWRQRQNWT